MAEVPDDEGFVAQLIYEGHCPHGHGQLEREEQCGWCPTCRLGWSAAGERWSMHWDDRSPGATIPVGGSYQFSQRLEPGGRSCGRATYLGA